VAQKSGGDDEYEEEFEDVAVPYSGFLGVLSPPRTYAKQAATEEADNVLMGIIAALAKSATPAPEEDSGDDEHEEEFKDAATPSPDFLVAPSPLSTPRATSATLLHMSVEDWLQRVQEAGELSCYLDVAQASFDNLGQVLRIYTVTPEDGTRVLNLQFFDDL